jgi:hypothetical protein
MAFIIKHSQDINPQKKHVEVKKENNEKEIVNVMDKISMAEAIINNEPVKEVKRIKKDKGLIERTESSKTILTEDNKQLLVD